MKDDVASYVAAVAMDATTPRVLRIAGDTRSAQELAGILAEITGERYRTLRVGGIGFLDTMIHFTKVVAPQPNSVCPPWQGMQYLRDMFTGDARLTPLDNERYPALQWTTVRALFAISPDMK